MDLEVPYFQTNPDGPLAGFVVLMRPQSRPLRTVMSYLKIAPV